MGVPGGIRRQHALALTSRHVLLTHETYATLDWLIH
jgi:hypothetical protein